jgi:hypothetical protein
MKIKQHIVTLILPSSSGGSLLTDHYSGAFLKQISRSALLAGVLGITVVLATSGSSTATGFNPLLINSVANKQHATNSQDGSFYQPPRSPAFDPDLFGS